MSSRLKPLAILASDASNAYTAMFGSGTTIDTMANAKNAYIMQFVDAS